MSCLLFGSQAEGQKTFHGLMWLNLLLHLMLFWHLDSRSITRVHTLRKIKNAHTQTDKKRQKTCNYLSFTHWFFCNGVKITTHVSSGNEPNKSALIYSRWWFSASVVSNLFPAPSSKGWAAEGAPEITFCWYSRFSRPESCSQMRAWWRTSSFENVSRNTSSPVVDFGVCTCTARPTVERFHAQNANWVRPEETENDPFL